MLILKQRTGHKPTYLLTTGACGSVQQYWMLLQNLPSKYIILKRVFKNILNDDT